MSDFAAARAKLEQEFLKLYDFVQKRGVRDFFDEGSSQILEFESGMIAYRNWLRDGALSQKIEAKAAVAMRKWCYDDVKKELPFRYALKYRGPRDDAVVLSHLWNNVIFALQDYTSLLKPASSWFSFPIWNGKNLPMQGLLLQLKQCVEES